MKLSSRLGAAVLVLGSWATVVLGNGPGGLAAGGGESNTTSFSLIGTLGGEPTGISSSTGYVLNGGIVASIPPSVPSELAVVTTPPGAAAIPEKTAYPVAATVVRGAGAAVEVRYRLGGEGPGSYRSVSMTSSNGTDFTATIPAADVGLRGVEYYIQAALSGLTATQPLVDPQNNPFLLRVAVNDVAAASLPARTFRMVGFPFEVAPNTVAGVFFDDLGNPDRDTWRLGRWNHALQDEDEYSDVGPIRAGRGYWVISLEAKGVDASGTSSVPDAVGGGKRYGTIDLLPGWNQIASPFAFPVSWADRIEDAPSEIEDVFWQYVGGDMKYVIPGNGLLTPFTGYWVRNAGTVTHTLQLPYQAASPGTSPRVAGRPEASSSDSWTLSVGVASGGIRDRTSVIGARPGAEEGHDPFDYGKPPEPPGRYLAIGFLPDADRTSGVPLAGDFRSPEAPGWQFPFVVRSDLGKPATLDLVGLAELPEGMEVSLLDDASRVSYRFGKTGSLVLPRKPTPEGNRYVLLVGPSGWVLSRGGTPTTLTVETRLLQNHPNPFPGSTSIRYSLPAPSRVRLGVVDVAGRRVATLVDGEIPAGDHVVRWDGRAEDGRTVAAGVYLYRLVTETTAASRRLVVLGRGTSYE